MILEWSSEVLNFVNFAVDTAVFFSPPSSCALYTCFKEELSKVSEWLRVNKLSLNDDKIRYMIICKNEVEEKKMEIASNSIKGTDKVEFLGILIDDRLSFNDHERGLQKQVSMASG